MKRSRTATRETDCEQSPASSSPSSLNGQNSRNGGSSTSHTSIASVSSASMPATAPSLSASRVSQSTTGEHGTISCCEGKGDGGCGENRKNNAVHAANMDVDTKGESPGCPLLPLHSAVTVTRQRGGGAHQNATFGGTRIIDTNNNTRKGLLGNLANAWFPFGTAASDQISTTGRGGGGAAAAMSIESSIATDANLVDGERLLAKELTSLSLKEREYVYEDIHGVRAPVEETEEFRQSKLKALEAEIKKSCHNRSLNGDPASKEAFCAASFLVPRVTSDVHLRLKILRSKFWDIKKSTTAVFRYFQVKQQLFGADKLLQPITFDDLLEDAQHAIKNGAYQVNDPKTDISGRTLMMDVVANWSFKSTLAQIQTSWYMSNVATHSVEAQRRGLVVSTYLGMEPFYFKQAITMAQWGFIDGVPVRVCAMHFCIPNPHMRPLCSLLLAAMPTDIRLRSKIYCGSIMECNYELVAIGYPSAMLPMDESGKLHQACIDTSMRMSRLCDEDERRRYDEGRPSHCVTTPPTSMDIISGRGRPCQQFAGNQRFNEFLLACKDAYYEKGMTKTQKTNMTLHIVQRLKKTGARFLKRDATGKWWEEMDDANARERVAMSLRNLARK
mmetsp:Transcript_24761/g.69522  ORF Transcript_24761/g.69522 Transcript_24761/m.69522 type:complete len:615 (-) Transcript_24761:109-1953(-)|eukprot:CAMPEP_0119561240 /NCGR_PEP_ID=MMETSP1352-20130426/17076_1 /TAXON_ID=265584 /ORGANISM="Stauroneis constricta, Strain CCMP1120" /LENGTH=614 /DNA_ID=CAMNT_0007609403 /DNA_START=32 /DNA_END=1876 /DNA_ORIENTATION=+